MYVRTISRKNKDGSVVEYVQLAHNYRDPEKGHARAHVVYSFGRKDELDVAAIKRLVRSLCRFLSSEDALQVEVLSRVSPWAVSTYSVSCGTGSKSEPVSTNP